MEVPAKKQNAGATKCVIHLVKNTPGTGPPAGTPAYTRTWSIAMRTMTRPRTMSSDAMRRVPDAASDDGVYAAELAVATLAMRSPGTSPETVANGGLRGKAGGTSRSRVAYRMSKSGFVVRRTGEPNTLQ